MNIPLLWILKIFSALLLFTTGCASKSDLDKLESQYKDAIISCEKQHPSGVGPQTELSVPPPYDYDPQPIEKCETFYRP